MPIPAIIAKLIKTAETKSKWNPADVRDEAKTLQPLMRLYLDLYEMDSTKLPALLDKHESESATKLELRKKLAAIFNYVPTIIRMAVNYIHSEEPTYDVSNDELKKFLANCDGGGRKLSEYVRREALPLALIMGWVDTLVQMPATQEGVFVTALDQQNEEGDVIPVVLTITPLQRTNWSVNRGHDYQWFRFKDQGNEAINPFDDPKPKEETYITVAAFNRVFDRQGNDVSIRDDNGNSVGYWVRSYKNLDSEGEGATDNKWYHDGDWLPTGSVPIATLYYQQSIDPERRHFGISKVSMIAILTRKILNILSWVDEDVLANLAFFVFPGNPPVDDKGKQVPLVISPFGVAYLGENVTIMPKVLQGEVSHIEIKLKIIDVYIREILRLAFLIGASADGEQITSGVQGVVARNELFQELRDMGGSLDVYATDILYFAACLMENKEIERTDFQTRYKPTVDYYKGSYTVEPMENLIKNAQSLIEEFSAVSPTMVKTVYRQLAQASTFNDDSNRETIFNEIKANFQASIDRQTAQDAAVTAAAAAAAAAQSTTTTPEPVA